MFGVTPSKLPTRYEGGIVCWKHNQDAFNKELRHMLPNRSFRVKWTLGVYFLRWVGLVLKEKQKPKQLVVCEMFRGGNRLEPVLQGKDVERLGLGVLTTSSTSDFRKLETSDMLSFIPQT